MRLDQLKFLVTVANLGSFTAAGETLHIAQPSISHSIAALERELGVTLLTRSRSGVVATEIGEEIIRHAVTMLDESRRIKDIAASATSDGKTTIIIAPALSASILPDLLDRLGPTAKNIEILYATTDRAEHLVARGEADLALVPFVNISDVNSAFRFTPLFVAQSMAVVHDSGEFSHRKTISFEEIQKHPISIFNSEFISFEPIMNRIRKYGEPNVLLKTRLPQPRLTKAIAENHDCVAISFDVTILKHSLTGIEGMVPLYIEDPVQLTFGMLEKNGRVLSSALKSVKKQLISISGITQQELSSFHDNLLAE